MGLGTGQSGTHERLCPQVPGMMHLLRLTWALATLCLVVANADRTAAPPDKASIFADLTPAELHAVRDFLRGRPELGLSAQSGDTLAQNTLFLVELLPPTKRAARAVIFFGAQAEPNVTEFAVGPLPRPRSYRPLRLKGGRTAPFAARPMTMREYELLHPLPHLLRHRAPRAGAR
ncbi:amiloride-sensitive amine oxidase [copper-containing]-like [Meleagris gallopavo]|uniref:amiloride-sensitive amine oxidase [copper-containing]-like n=1 Tax=Meleagris gallopavo TaxID=9103 RepID=UPI000549ADBF|nr:amiloride-sensitive amine oxidase [copper-containing]-like [Meleagris gallopavo]